MMWRSYILFDIIHCITYVIVCYFAQVIGQMGGGYYIDLYYTSNLNRNIKPIDLIKNYFSLLQDRAVLN